MSNSTWKVTFTFLFPSWVEPFLRESFTDFLIRTQAILDPGIGGQAPGPDGAQTGPRAGRWLVGAAISAAGQSISL